MQRFVVIGNALLRGDVFQVTHAVLDADPVEIVNLAAGQNRRDDLVLLGRRQNEHGMRGRLLERLEESVEGLKRKHMDLVDDVDAVTAYLRRDTDLFGQRTNIVHRVVRCGVQFVNIERAALVERPARLALVAGLAVGGRIEAVDRLGENARAGRFADAARTAEQVSVGQLPARDRVAQRRCDMRLPDDRRECRGTVLAGGNDEIIHDFSYLTKIRKFGRNPQAARKIPDREQRHLRLLQTQGRTTDTSMCRGRNSRNGPGSCVDSARCRRAHLGFRRTGGLFRTDTHLGANGIRQRSKTHAHVRHAVTRRTPRHAASRKHARGAILSSGLPRRHRQLRRDNSSHARRRSVRTD